MNLKRLAQITTAESLERFLTQYYDGSLEQFYLDLNRESDRLIRTDLKKAAQLSEYTTGLEQLLPDRYRGHLYRIWGRHAHLSGDYPRAKRLYKKAISLFSRVGDYDGRAKVQKALPDVLAYLGQYDEAARVGRQSLRYYRCLNAATDYAQVLTNLGNLYHRLDENKKALRYYNQAYEVFRDLDNRYALAVVQFNRGNIYSNLNELNESERLYRQAASIYRSLNMELAAAQADYSLAYIAFLKGRYSESLVSFGRVGNEFRRLGDHRCLALSELDRAEVQLHLNLYSQAIDDALAVAEEFGRLKMGYEQAKAYYFAAAGYFAFGDFASVTRLARKALAAFKRERNRVWQVMCRFILAKVDCQEGRLKKAIHVFQGIGAYYKRHGNIRQYHDVRLAYLEALIVSKNRKTASLMIQGINRSRRELAGYQRFLFHKLVGDFNQDRSRSRRAVAHYRRAIAEAERLQTTIFPDEIRRFFWVDKLAAYNRLAAIYLGGGQNRKAFDILEKGKNALAPISYAGSPGDDSISIPQALKEEQTRLKAFLRKALIPAGSVSRGAAATRRVRSAEQRLWRIERTIREAADVPGWGEFASFRKPEEIQKALESSDAVIQYVCREDICGVFVITATAFTYLPLVIGFEAIRALLARFYFLINSVSRRDDDKPVINDLLAQLSDYVWKPVQPLLNGTRRILLVPDGILARLPFSILRNGDDSLLFERYDLHLHSSSSSITDSARVSRAVRNFRRPAVVAVSSADLPGAWRESVVVSRHFTGARVLTGDDATSAALFDQLKKKDGLVHLAAHAAQSYENHLFSQILLADGPLYSFDLMRRHIASELVVLSGCQTGDPGLYYNSDSLSLAQSFLAAGARNVIASYWPVSDENTCRFMDHFYTHLRGDDIFPALRAAMTEMRKTSGRVRDWAAFYLACR